jgi:hypothetical protein
MTHWARQIQEEKKADIFSVLKNIVVRGPHGVYCLALFHIHLQVFEVGLIYRVWPASSMMDEMDIVVFLCMIF